MKQLLVRLVAQSTHSLILQVPRALVASVIAAMLDFGLLVALVEWAGWGPQTAAVASYLIAGVLQYTLCAVWVFPAAPQSVATGFAYFTFLSLVGLAITWATIGGLHDLAHVNYMLAKVVALGLSFVWNFTSRKYLLFKPRQTAPLAAEASGAA